MKKEKKQAAYAAKPKKMSVVVPTTKENLEYDKDFSKWARNQAKFLRKGEFTKLDMDNLIEEIEDLSRRESDKLSSHLENLLMHKLKSKYQPQMHTVSWDLSIEEASRKSQRTLEKNPSLKPKLKDIVEDAYSYARLKAARETEMDLKIFPEQCPWSLKVIFPNLENKYCK